MPLVVLTGPQMVHAALAGTRRQNRHRDENWEKQTNHRIRTYDGSYCGDIKSAIAEQAVAVYYAEKWNNRDWALDDPDWDKKVPDVEPNFEVRRIYGQFVPVRDSDQDWWIIIAVRVSTNHENHIEIMGGMAVSEARKRFPIAGRPGYARIPATALHDPNAFKRQ